MVIVVAGLVAWALYANWTRPGRLEQSACRELVLTAYRNSQEGMPSGKRVFRFDFGNRAFIVPGGDPEPDQSGPIKNRLQALFPRTEPDAEFFERVSLTHRGRVRVAGRWCESVRIAPNGYEGHSVELWIDPDSGMPLGWRRLDTRGNLVRGYRYFRADTESGDDSLFTDEDFPIEDMLGEPGLEIIPPEQLEEIFSRGHLVRPSVLPPGFRIIGGRGYRQFGMMGVPGADQPGMGPGMLPGRVSGEPIPPGAGHFTLYFSDGLNTITSVQMIRARFADLPIDPERFRGVLDFKAGEIQRIFHTSVSGRMWTGGLVLLYGEVSKDWLDRVAASFPDEGPAFQEWPGPGPGGFGGMGRPDRPGGPDGRQRGRPDGFQRSGPFGGNE